MNQQRVLCCWKQLAFSLLLVFASVAYGGDIFGDGLSEREKFEVQRSTENLTNVEQSIELQLDMMRFQAFAEGRCEDFFELEMAAKKGDPKSEYLLSDLYRNGYCVPQDDERALLWLKKAAEAGYENAYFDLGYFLLIGVGGTKNPRAAIAWLERAKKERPEAYYLLSGAYWKGEGVPQNYEKALDYALEGAAYGHVPALGLSALLLSMPSFPFYDPASAYQWGLLAKAAGRDDNIAAALGEVMPKLESFLTPKQISEAQSAAARWKVRTPPEEARVDPTDFDLPVLDEGYSKNLSPKQARDRLSRLGLDQDRFVFFKAIAEDNLEVTRLYVRAGASIETVSGWYQTPLIHAARNGSERVAKYLVTAGADISRSVNHGDDSPVLVALSAGHRNIAELLISKGAKLDHPGIMYNAVEFNDPTLLAMLKSKGVRIDQDYVGTPLSHAVSALDDKGDVRCYERSAAFLIEQGARLDGLDPRGESMLQSAIGTVSPSECVRLLLENGVSQTASYGREPLFIAIISGKHEVVELLLEHGADPNLRYELEAGLVPMILVGEAKSSVMNGGSVLQLAVVEQHAAIARLLVRYGADPRAADKLGRTPLSIAEKRGDKLMVSVLVGEM